MTHNELGDILGSRIFNAVTDILETEPKNPCSANVVADIAEKTRDAFLKALDKWASTARADRSFSADDPAIVEARKNNP